MSLQSRFVSCGEGESRRKNSYGDSLPLVECAAAARFENTSSSTGGFQGLPSESFLLPSPGRLSTGLKTQRGYCPVRRLQGLIVSFVKCEGGIVAAAI